MSIMKNMKTQHFLFESTGRNRTQHPGQGEFVIAPTSQTSGRMMDPVSAAAMDVRWTGWAFETTGPGAAVVCTTVDSTGYGDTHSTIECVADALNTFQRERDYYKGSTMRTGVDRVRIKSSVFMGVTVGGSDRMMFILEHEFSGGVGSSCTITDPTDLTHTSHPLFFVPNGGVGNDHNYEGRHLYNITRSVATGAPISRVITRYDNRLQLARLDTGESFAPVAGWLPTDTYCIRESIPIVVGMTSNSAGSYALVSLPTGSRIDASLYVGRYIHVTTGAAATETRRISAAEMHSGEVTGATAISLTLPTTMVVKSLVGAFIVMTTGAAVGESVLVTAYNELTHIASTSPAFTAAVNAGDAFEIRTIQVTDAFTSPVDAGDSIEIWSDIADNAMPFPAFSQPINGIAWNVRLSHVILPTADVVGGRELTNVSHMFVTICNTPTEHARAVIQKNSSSAPHATFCVAVGAAIRINDRQTHVMVQGDTTVREVHLAPNRPIYIAIHLPDGRLYQTDIVDTISPYPPIDRLQLSVAFAVTPVSSR
jgi:hypothetical protein